jgi:hypothetical protein
MFRTQLFRPLFLFSSKKDQAGYEKAHKVRLLRSVSEELAEFNRDGKVAVTLRVTSPGCCGTAPTVPQQFARAIGRWAHHAERDVM